MSSESDVVTLASNAGAGNGTATRFGGGMCTLLAEGTWGGGNVKVQVMCPNGTWADISGLTLSANGMTAGHYLPSGQYRAVVTTSTAVYAKLAKVVV